MIESGLVAPDHDSLVVGAICIVLMIHFAFRAASYLKLWRRWR